MDLKCESENFCLFCLNETLPCIIPYSEGVVGEYHEDGGIGGEEVVGSSSSATTTTASPIIIPTFRVVCSYLGIKLSVQHGSNDKEGQVGGEDSESIFSACCDKFLCFECFKKVHHLRLLYGQLEKIRDKIKVSTEDIKTIIVESTSGLGTESRTIGGRSSISSQPQVEFSKVFESHLRKVLVSSSVWKEKRDIDNAGFNLLQGHEVLELNEKECPATSNSKNPQPGASMATSEDDGDGRNTLESSETSSDDESEDESSQNEEEDTDSNRSQTLSVAVNTMDSQGPMTLRDLAEVEMDGRKWLQCPHCSKPYEKIKSLQTHITRSHSIFIPDSSFSTCSICQSLNPNSNPRKYGSQELLDRHIFWKHTSGPKFNCEQCPKKYYSKQRLTNHIKSEHDGIRHPCTNCSKTFVDESQLKRHVKLTHTKQNLHVCHVCSKTFAIPTHLKNHLLTHDAKATLDHICDICGKSFLTQARLRKHVYQVHEPEKSRRHQCELCPKKFKGRLELENHVRTHTQEKPFKCPICDKFFTQKSQRNKHVKTMHEQTPKTRGRKRKIMENEGLSITYTTACADGNAEFQYFNEDESDSD